MTFNFLDVAFSLLIDCLHQPMRNMAQEALVVGAVSQFIGKEHADFLAEITIDIDPLTSTIYKLVCQLGAR